jgi:hypothetical protein
MIIMMAANRMNPTAQPLVAFPARPADWYCDGDCSVICRTSLCGCAGRVNTGSAARVRRQRHRPTRAGSGITLQRMNL